jgi:hypothetical protein
MSEEDKNVVRQAQEAHRAAARAQRQMMKDAVARYTPVIDPGTYFVPHYVDEKPPEQEVLTSPEALAAKDGTVLLQMEDFGGNLTLPWYTAQRPGADYYASNLSIYNFVIANCTEAYNKVYLYDERGMGKGADAVCSLRFYYHFERMLKRRVTGPPTGTGTQYDTLFTVVDNCVGQNKSQMTMKFAAMLSLLFYKKVVLLFLLPGHSHMAPDRVVSWMRESLGKKKGNGLEANCFLPEEIVKQINTIRSVSGEFLDHNSPNRPMFSDWDSILFHLKNMPTGYTSNYFFEFSNGEVHMGSCFTSELEVHRFTDDPQDAAAAIEHALFNKPIGEATFDDVQLRRTPLQVISQKKLESMAEKYSSIPREALPYYPKPVLDSGSNKRKLELYEVATDQLAKAAVKIVRTEICGPKKGKGVIIYVGQTLHQCWAKQKLPMPEESMVCATPPQLQQPASLPVVEDLVTPVVVFENLQLNHIYPGFLWARESCALDTICVTLMYCIYSLPVDDVRRREVWNIPKLRCTLPDVATVEHFTSAVMQRTKQQMISTIYQCSYKNELLIYGTKTTLDIILNDLYRSPTNGSMVPCSTVHITKRHRFGCKCGFTFYGSRFHAPWLTVTFDEDCRNLVHAIQIALSGVPANRRACAQCHTVVEAVAEYINIPYMLLVDVAFQVHLPVGTAVDPYLEFQGKSYRLFAVCYYGSQHFTAKIRIGESFYDYDGLLNNLQHCDSNNLYFNYANHGTRTKEASLLWYLKM